MASTTTSTSSSTTTTLPDCSAAGGQCLVEGLDPCTNWDYGYYCPSGFSCCAASSCARVTSSCASPSATITLGAIPFSTISSCTYMTDERWYTVNGVANIPITVTLTKSGPSGCEMNDLEIYTSGCAFIYSSGPGTNLVYTYSFTPTTNIRVGVDGDTLNFNCPFTLDIRYSTSCPTTCPNANNYCFCGDAVQSIGCPINTYCAFFASSPHTGEYDCWPCSCSFSTCTSGICGQTNVCDGVNYTCIYDDVMARWIWAEPAAVPSDFCCNDQNCKDKVITCDSPLGSYPKRYSLCDTSLDQGVTDDDDYKCDICDPCLNSSDCVPTYCCSREIDTSRTGSCTGANPFIYQFNSAYLCSPFS